jgi:hypothetical protein
MDERLQEMLDHYEIRKTLSEYCSSCDRCDETWMRSVYLEDSWDEHGVFEAPGPQYAKIMAEQILLQTDSLYHLLGQSLIKVEGDKAGAETYFFAASTSKGEDGVEMCNQLGGRFVDKLERENGRWLIKHRIVVRDWAVSVPVEHDWTRKSGLRNGSRSNADPVFATLGIVHSGQPPQTGTN